ncbi:MAG TPA: VWA domain-containing protein [Candidatus Eremiobacteraceae bacterium]|nr:VWA domain-containing protein [Candidatus Eremiobacteraceae bacterium]
MDSRRSLSIRELDTTRRQTDIRFHFLPNSFQTLILILVFLFCGCSASAQNPFPTPQPPPPDQAGQPSGQQGGSIKVAVNLVVLHTSVLDKTGKFIDDLKQENFRVFEDNAEQKLSVFRNEDIPVSMGLVIDNSGSMKEKRSRVNEAALTLVQASNPQDEAFVVNFNDDFFLDLDKDFTSSIPELREALERIDARGSTALYDAIIGSLDHLKKASKDKRVLLVVTDGDDNTSRNSLEKTLRELQKTSTVVYTIGLLGKDSGEDKRTIKKAKKALQEIANASGGLAFFPASVAEVHAICEQVAHDIRHQYTLAYYPTNTAQDGTFRSVKVDVIPPRGRGKLVARTRNGYYAPGGAPQGRSQGK